MKTRIAILFVALSLLLNSSAQAQGHERREHERERFRTPHWVLDEAWNSYTGKLAALMSDLIRAREMT